MSGSMGITVYYYHRKQSAPCRLLLFVRVFYIAPGGGGTRDLLLENAPDDWTPPGRNFIVNKNSAPPGVYSHCYGILRPSGRQGIHQHRRCSFVKAQQRGFEQEARGTVLSYALLCSARPSRGTSPRGAFLLI